jgi:hypothetical protein
MMIGAAVPSLSQRGLLTDKPPIRAKLALTGGDLVIESPRPEPAWLWSTLHAFKRITELPAGWDSYGGAPPYDTAIVAALEALVNLLGQEGAAPQVVPSSSGAVQLEWHRRGMDLEIVASTSGVLSAYYCEPAAGVDWQVERLENKDMPRLAAILGDVVG